MELRKVVGQNLSRLSLAKGWNRAELGRQIGIVTGKAWSRQLVSLAVRGERAFTVDDLVTLAFVLEVPPGTLLLFPARVDKIVVGGKPFRRDQLESPRWERESTSAALAELQVVLSSITRGLDALQDDSYKIWELTKSLTTATMMLQLRTTFEEKGVELPQEFE